VTRHRIERNLHDGAQQRLVGLVLALRKVQGAATVDAPELDARIGEVADEMVRVVDELREIARGLHPAALAEGGLRPALRTLARRSTVPVRLDVELDERLPEPIELAADYVVAEALTNAAKHAHASVADVEAYVRTPDGPDDRVNQSSEQATAGGPVGFTRAGDARSLGDVVMALGAAAVGSGIGHLFHAAGA
jgi:signal transduction histidine kinase